MANVITANFLEAVVDRINRKLGTPATPYDHTQPFTCVPNEGNYHLDWAYGKVALVRMSKGGGQTDVFSGYYSKPELCRLCMAFIAGLDATETFGGK